MWHLYWHHEYAPAVVSIDFTAFAGKNIWDNCSSCGPATLAANTIALLLHQSAIDG